MTSKLNLSSPRRRPKKVCWCARCNGREVAYSTWYAHNPPETRGVVLQYTAPFEEEGPSGDVEMEDEWGQHAQGDDEEDEGTMGDKEGEGEVDDGDGDGDDDDDMDGDGAKEDEDGEGDEEDPAVSNGNMEEAIDDEEDETEEAEKGNGGSCDGTMGFGIEEVRFNYFYSAFS